VFILLGLKACVVSASDVYMCLVALTKSLISLFQFISRDVGCCTIDIVNVLISATRLNSRDDMRGRVEESGPGMPTQARQAPPFEDSTNTPVVDLELVCVFLKNGCLYCDEIHCCRHTLIASHVERFEEALVAWIESHGTAVCFIYTISFGHLVQDIFRYTCTIRIQAIGLMDTQM